MQQQASKKESKQSTKPNMVIEESSMHTLLQSKKIHIKEDLIV